jgi:glycosyltransferase involved in cell wall biosynthesis
LRRVEGFEMACIEGAMSGAVPIVPFLPTYDYYKDFGLYIFMDGDITDQLINIFDKSYVPLTQDQLYYVRDEFSWKNICEKIYKRLIYD